MTEEEWCSSGDPAAMLAWLERRLLANQRKLRLFVCACCRQAWDQLRPALRDMVEVAEEAADLDPWYRPASAALNSRFYGALIELHQTPLGELEEEIRSLAARVVFGVEKKSASRTRALCPPSTPKAQADLLRELFGNPFRQVRLVRASLRHRVRHHSSAKKSKEILFVREWLGWRQGLIGQLAQAIHEERAFERLPILADALEDAGCDEVELLDHLRHPGPHVRGCWALDLLLGK